MESGYEMRISVHPVSSGKVYNKLYTNRYFYIGAISFFQQIGSSSSGLAIIHSYPLFTDWNSQFSLQWTASTFCCSSC